MVALGVGSLQATTGTGGFALQNATPTIVTWTPPNDGQMHRFEVFGLVNITSGETGGQIKITFTDPGGNARSINLQAGSAAAGGQPFAACAYTCQGGSAVSVVQATALTAGAAVAWAEIWGS